MHKITVFEVSRNDANDRTEVSFSRPGLSPRPKIFHPGHKSMNRLFEYRLNAKPRVITSGFAPEFLYICYAPAIVEEGE